MAAALAGAALAATALAAPVEAMSGGRPAAPGEAPWSATLVARGPGPVERRASCSGALVAPTKVLTAAHCLAGIPADELTRAAEIRVGARVLSSDPGVVAGIARADLHPRFRLLPSPAAPQDDAAASATYDVAVVTLDRPVRGIRPVVLAAGRPAPGTRATLYGHGITGPGEPQADVLRAGRFRVARLATCARATPATVDAAAMGCITSPDARACTGDSGGPVVARRHGRPALVGVFSFGMETAGRPCGSPGPDVVTRVDAVRGWIASHLRDARPARRPVRRRPA